MKPSLFYRIAAVILLLFAAGHTLGFQQVDPAWGIGPVIDAMQSRPFDVQGFTRTYWDFFVGAGFTISVLYLFAALLAWQLASLPVETLRRVRATTWGFPVAFAVIAIVSWRHLFWIPVVQSALIAMCLALAAASVPERRD